MYIEPNSTVKLLKGVPLDTSYRNTVVWDSVTAQVNGFSTFTKHTLSNQTYQRINKGIFRCDKSADVCYDCNYMMFQNTAYGNKWFYAFINKVEYINNSMCQITFTLDIIQTWYNEWSFESCFVERETVASDNIGEHLIDENIAIGETVMDNYYKMIDLSKYSAIYIEYLDKNVNAQNIDNIFSGLTVRAYAFTEAGIQNASDFIASFSAKPQSIVAVYMVSTDLMQSAPSETGSVVTNGAKSPVIEQIFNKADTVGNYTPRNKKLLTYPYSYLSIYDSSGNQLPLRYEFFSTDTCNVDIVANILNPIKILVTPKNYKGSSSNSGDIGDMPYTNLNETLTISGLPMCPWYSDAYFSILGTAQISSIIANQKPIELPSNFGGVGKQIENYIAGGVKFLQNQFTEAIDLIRTGVNEFKGNTPRGNAENVSPLVAHSMLGIYKANVHVTEEVARCIDNYFDMYGYKVDTLKVPNVRNRPHWTFIKTKGCNIRGSMPADDVSAIEDIIDKGITFWRNINEVGNYSLNNSV